MELRGLTLIPNPRNLTPAGDGNTLSSPGHVIIKKFVAGTVTLRNVKFLVCNVQDSCAPAAGLLGRDLFPALGISVHGVPHNFPRNTEQDEDEVDDPESYFNSDKDWLKEHQIDSASRAKLFEAIQPNLTANADLPVTGFCSHPSANVKLDTGDAKPTYVPQYRLSDRMSSHVTLQLHKWIANGVVVKAPADSPWNSPLLAAWNRAAQAKGKDPRICIDPRRLNNLLADDPRPLPDVSDIHQRLQGFKFISEIDLQKGFNQFLIFDTDQVKTTFTWQGQKWMFRGAPFGLKPLSQMFQSVIEQILSEVREFSTPFIDNVYIHTNTTIEDHIAQVNRVLAIFNKWHLRLNLDKCNFGYKAVNVLGHLLSGDSKKPDPDKISALHSWPTPKTGNDIEKFLGFTNYLRQHVPLYAEIAAPLEALRKIKMLDHLWDDNCQRSFAFLKKVLSNAPVLNTPLPAVPYCLSTDASQTGIGWCLYQIDPSTQLRRYILFGAKALNPAQRNYGATRRELLAIVVALQACRHYIYGYKFTLYTDHMALTYLFTQKHVNYMTLNWLDTLLDYDFTVVHRPGIQMVLPDALSRMYADFRGGCGAPRVRSLMNSELTKYPDQELQHFIDQRFDKTFVAADKRQALLQAHHVNGHFGAEALFASLWHKGNYWPGMRQDCVLHVGGCLECLRYNVGKAGYHTRQSIHAEFPFEHIAIDTLTGFKTTERGNNVILVITDICTRFKIIVPQQSKSAADTAASLWKVLCTFPVPKIIQSDNGTEFCNATIKELMSMHGIDHRLIAAYNPRANGSAENAVGNTENVLRKLLNGNMTDWDLFLPAVQLALNSKPNNSTKSSPASLLFGMDVNQFANYDKAHSKLLTEHALIERAKVINELIRPTSQTVFLGAQKRRTDNVNRKIRATPPIAVGSLVMLKDPTRSSKHQPYWVGPYRIVQQKKGGNYVLQNPDSSLHHRQPPRDHLKLIESGTNLTLEDIYYVERIVDHKGPKNKRQYLIKWLNYPVANNTWEPETNLVGCERYLQEYWANRSAA